MGQKSGNKKNKKGQLPKNIPVETINKTNINKWAWVALAIVVVTTFAIYFKAIRFDILLSWDDNIYIRNNSHIKDLHWANIKLFFSNFYVDNYQPLSMLFYAFDYKIGAGNASILHLSNILLHLANTCLVYVLVRKLTAGSTVVALITAGFFGIHPMHVESVAWVAERKDVLYSFFFLLSLIVYSNYLKTLKPKLLIISGFLFLLSCLSKSAAVVLPLVMLLFDYYTNRKLSWKMMIEKVPFFAISLVFGIVATYSQKHSIQILAPNMSFVEHVSVVSYSFISYLFKAIVPLNLSAIYTYPTELGSMLPIKYYISVLLVGFVLILVWFSRKWGKDVIFGFLFFIITIILVLQFVPVGVASMADRYTYIPYIGLFFMIGKLYERWSLNENVAANYKKYSFIVLVLGFVALSTIAYNRVKIWENDELLFSDVINKYPNCAFPYNGRGTYYLNHYANGLYAHDKPQRELYLRKASSDFEYSLTFKLTPDVKVDIYYNLGVAKGNLGDYVSAIQNFDEAIKIDSNYASAYMNRGGAKYMLKDLKAAYADCKKAIEINPQDPVVLQNMDIMKAF